MAYTKEEHQQASAKIPRDTHGHFSAKESNTSNPSAPSNPSVSSSPFRSFSEGGSLLKRIFPTGTSLKKATDENTLIDVHVGNPLKKIVDLLSDIKKQKAFSFNLKGSLGFAGVVLVLTGMGLFGGTQAFCDKGSQSHFGTIKVLNIQEEVKESQIPLLSSLTSLIFPTSPTLRNRAVLFKQDTTIIRLVHTKNFSLTQFTNLPVYPEQSRWVIATGNYNSCSQTLTLKDSNGIELFK